MVSALSKALLILVAMTGAGCMNCSKYITQPTITSRTGATLCARHHIPLVTVNGWEEHQDRITLYDSVYMQLVVETCNPNFVLRNQSLHRTARYHVPTKITY